MNNTESMNGKVKFLQHGVRSLATGKVHPCWYSHTTLIDGTTCVTLYAKSYSLGLPSEVRPKNGSDMMTDYFETDHVRFYEGSAEYVELLKLIEHKRRCDEARQLKRQAARAMREVSRHINLNVGGMAVGIGY
jgi:hypothetical protein